MKALVTGGAGFIGSAVCRHLVGARAASVINVDKLNYAADLGSLMSIADSPQYRLERLDIGNRAGVELILAREQPDVIFHLAAETHVDRSITGPAEFISTNIVGTYTLLDAARSYWERLPGSRQDRFRFLHVSTDEVFGSLCDGGIFTESSRYDPSSPYSASKAAADHLVQAWRRTYGLPALIVNCSNNYGPFQFPDKLIPLMITNALTGLDLPIYGSGKNVRDWLYVEDHARALVELARRGRAGERYNIGARSEHTNVEVVEVICDLLDVMNPRADGNSHRTAIRFVADRPGHDFRYAIDPSKLESEMGWMPSETFQTGIEKTVAWYLAHTGWWRKLRARRYDGRRLGLPEVAA